MMPRILIATALLLGFANTYAFRVLNPVETPVELALSALTLPSSVTGTVTFRACADCPYRTHRLSDQPKFLINHKTVTFDEFLEVAGPLHEQRATADATIVGLFLDVNTARVTRISLGRTQQ
jgi:hypothetical protein